MIEKVTTLRPAPRKPRASVFPEGFVMGASVKLRSGGAVMSVTQILSGEPPAVHCEWHSGDFYPHEKSYPVASLRLATEEEIAGGDSEVVFEPEE